CPSQLRTGHFIIRANFNNATNRLSLRHHFVAPVLGVLFAVEPLRVQIHPLGGPGAYSPTQFRLRLLPWRGLHTRCDAPTRHRDSWASISTAVRSLPRNVLRPRVIDATRRSAGGFATS